MTEPDKTIHEDLGLTAAMDFRAPFDESLRGDPAETDADASSSLEEPESAWTWRRVAIAATIVAVAAGELIWALSARDSLASRRRATEALSESDKAALEAKRERFEKLDPVEQARLRELQSELARDASPDSLYATLEDYLKWKSQLAPQESALLAGLDPDDRTERVVAVAAEQKALADRTFSESDSKKLIAWLESEVRKRQVRILETLPDIMRERFENMGDRERSFALMYHILSTRGGGTRMDEIAGDLPKLRAQLSPSAQARWDVAAKNKDDLKALLTDWIRQSFERTLSHREGGKAYLAIDEKELQRFFEQGITESERRRLLALPTEDMISQLRREYIRSKSPWKDQNGKPLGFGGRQPFGPMHEDGRGGMFRRPPDDGRDGPPGKPGERRPNGPEPPPPPPPPRDGEFRGDFGPGDGGPREGGPKDGRRRDDGMREGGPRGDREKRFGPAGGNPPEPKPGFDQGPNGDAAPPRKGPPPEGENTPPSSDASKA